MDGREVGPGATERPVATMTSYALARRDLQTAVIPCRFISSMPARRPALATGNGDCRQSRQRGPDPRRLRLRDRRQRHSHVPGARVHVRIVVLARLRDHVKEMGPGREEPIAGVNVVRQRITIVAVDDRERPGQRGDGAGGVVDGLRGRAGPTV